jgi:hypothetical protein
MSSLIYRFQPVHVLPKCHKSATTLAAAIQAKPWVQLEDQSLNKTSLAHWRASYRIQIAALINNLTLMI